jgi:hypothetical protein
LSVCQSISFQPHEVFVVVITKKWVDGQLEADIFVISSH